MKPPNDCILFDISDKLLDKIDLQLDSIDLLLSEGNWTHKGNIDTLLLLNGWGLWVINPLCWWWLIWPICNDKNKH